MRCWAGESEDERQEGEASEDADIEQDPACDVFGSDGIAMPQDLEQKHVEEGEHGYEDEDDGSDSCSDDDMEDYDGEEPLGSGDEVEQGEASAAAIAGKDSSHQARMKAYRLSSSYKNTEST